MCGSVDVSADALEPRELGLLAVVRHQQGSGNHGPLAKAVLTLNH